MIDVQGFRLEQAVACLQKEGYAVKTMEVSSRKGVVGNEQRVIRQQYSEETEGGEVLLTFSVFRTECDRIG